MNEQPDAKTTSTIVSMGPIISLVITAISAACAYHGYKRNESVGWAIWWGIAGAAFPVITPVIALAQGFGKPGPELPAGYAHG